MERPPLRHSRLHRVARRLATALVDGRWEAGTLAERARAALAVRDPFIRGFVERLIAALGTRARPRLARVVRLLTPELARRAAYKRGAVVRLMPALPAPEMSPSAGPPQTWPVPPIATEIELAAWLDVEPGTLAWLADLQGRERCAPPGPLRRYDYRWVAKRDGSARLVEAPRSRLKSIQRRILDEILVHVPPHDAAHGFRAGRSIRSFAAPHVGQYVVVKLDLRHFFPSVGFGRVLAVLMTAGYPERVARVLAGLCTNRAPEAVWTDPAVQPAVLPSWDSRMLHRQAHLPQGAPTSPALGNLAAYRLDLRLDALARTMGGAYTRYADDLAFSGDVELGRAVRRLCTQVAAIARDEGFTVHAAKTRVMRRAARQRIAGVVVNAHTSVGRAVRDALRATLHNCARHGPHSQNRDGHPDFRAHLAGRVSHLAMLDPLQGRKLWIAFDRIDWSARPDAAQANEPNRREPDASAPA